MRPMLRRPLLVLAVSLSLAVIPVAAQARGLRFTAQPKAPAAGLQTVLVDAWSAIQGLFDKLLSVGDAGTTTTTQTTPPPSSGTTITGGSENGPGIDPNG